MPSGNVDLYCIHNDEGLIQCFEINIKKLDNS